MAVAALSTAARGADTPAPVGTFASSARWTEDPHAQMLLSSCVESPPKGVWRSEAFGRVRDRWFEYAGRRVERLEAIRSRIGRTALDQYDRLGEEGAEAFRDWCNQPGVTEAIELARSGASTSMTQGG
ncbi:hypothetical protein [Sphingomonas sp. Leaf33]|uniref:hypothetical protein n=1 Tax=Sphingomonas sp. Leaf33 TaxID=1736215 RepID=UPI000B2920A8|nr:hypothetical protein [Sphingomonas sp. Leaf33]